MVIFFFVALLVPEITKQTLENVPTMFTTIHMQKHEVYKTIQRLREQNRPHKHRVQRTHNYLKYRC